MKPRIESLETRWLLTGPSAAEQELYYDINHLRVDPQGELNYLFTLTSPSLVSPDLSVNLAMTANLVSTSQVLSDFQALTSVAPLSWNSNLATAAATHNTKMVNAGQQSHQVAGESNLATRTAAAGYSNASTLLENVYGYSGSPFQTDSAFAIDWGNSSKTHRNNMMSTSVREVGLSITPENNILTLIGPNVVTEDFGARTNYGNPYIVGVIFSDLDGNGRYDAGEGLSGVNVTISDGVHTYNTTTASAGGYQLQMPAGTYTVTASGGTLSGTKTLEVTVGTDNREVDFVNGFPGGFVDFQAVTGPVDKIGVMRLGQYFFDSNGNRRWDGETTGDSFSFYGNTLDVPIKGDWNGDGQDELGVFRGGEWYFDMNGNGVWDGVSGGDSFAQFGIPLDTPVVGDWNGDGVDEIGVWRGGQWFLDMNGNKSWDSSDTSPWYGGLTDTPIVGDWNGNGTDKIGVKRFDNWYLDVNGNRQWDDTIGGDALYTYGLGLDLPVIGDWDGNGKDEIGVMRGGDWYLDSNGNGVWNGPAGGDSFVNYGIILDVPMAGKWHTTGFTGTDLYNGVITNNLPTLPALSASYQSGGSSGNDTFGETTEFSGSGDVSQMLSPGQTEDATNAPDSPRENERSTPRNNPLKRAKEGLRGGHWGMDRSSTGKDTVIDGKAGKLRSERSQK